MGLGPIAGGGNLDISSPKDIVAAQQYCFAVSAAAGGAPGSTILLAAAGRACLWVWHDGRPRARCHFIALRPRLTAPRSSPLRAPQPNGYEPLRAKLHELTMELQRPPRPCQVGPRALPSPSPQASRLAPSFCDSAHPALLDGKSADRGQLTSSPGSPLPHPLTRPRHSPPAARQVTVTCGSTYALDVALDLLLERGDPLLLEEFTYSHALEAQLMPKGCAPGWEGHGSPHSRGHLARAWSAARCRAARFGGAHRWWPRCALASRGAACACNCSRLQFWTPPPLHTPTAPCAAPPPPLLSPSFELLPVPMDGEGMVPTALDAMLVSRRAAGLRMPRVVYTIPSGQNPTGAAMGPGRRADIYEVCRRHGLVIVEDDAYSWLQYPGGEAAVPGLKGLQRERARARAAFLVHACPRALGSRVQVCTFLCSLPCPTPAATPCRLRCWLLTRPPSPALPLCFPRSRPAVARHRRPRHPPGHLL